MSILITDMEMPNKKNGAVLIIYPNGDAVFEDGYHYKAIPVPPHGRLGDLDAVCSQLLKQQMIDRQPRAILRAWKIVNNADVIIPAEEGGCGRCDHCRIPQTGTCRYAEEGE